MANCNENINQDCNDNPCGCKTSSDDVVYQGPLLPCTLIENCTTVTEVITTINTYFCGPEFAANIINIIINNPALLEQLTTIINQSLECETIWACETTTTTTTIELTCLSYDITINQEYINLSDEGNVAVVWSSCPDGKSEAQFYSDAGTYDDALCSVSLPSIIGIYYVDSEEYTFPVFPVLSENPCTTSTTTTTIEETTTTTTTANPLFLVSKPLRFPMENVHIDILCDDVVVDTDSKIETINNIEDLVIFLNIDPVFNVFGEFGQEDVDLVSLLIDGIIANDLCPSGVLSLDIYQVTTTTTTTTI